MNGVNLGTVNELDTVHLQQWLRDSRNLVKELWKAVLPEAEIDKLITTGFGEYVHQYHRRCRQVSANDIAKLKHRDLVDACQVMLKGKLRSACLDTLTQSKSNPFKADVREGPIFAMEWLKFAANALLLINIDTWQNDVSLFDHLQETRFAPSNDKSKGRLRKSFHVVNIERVGGIQISWTDELSQHLLLNDNGADFELLLFRHVDLLPMMKQGGLLTSSFVEETMRTFGILIPHWNREVSQWFARERAANRLSMSVMPSTQIQPEDRCIESFSIWHDRLYILKEQYDEHEPAGLLQNLYDDRNPARRWAFWVAVMIFVIGMSQVLLAILQVYKAFNPS